MFRNRGPPADDSAFVGGYVDSKGRRSDREGFASPSQAFLDMLRDRAFVEDLIIPARRYVQETLPARRREALESRRGKRIRAEPRLAAELGHQYRVTNTATATQTVADDGVSE